jgi:hypothetical protein
MNPRFAHPCLVIRDFPVLLEMLAGKIAGSEGKGAVKFLEILIL